MTPLTCVCVCAAGAIWTNTMPVKLAQHLPDVPQETRDQLFGSRPSRRCTLTGVSSIPTTAGWRRRLGDTTRVFVSPMERIALILALRKSLARSLPQWTYP